jgi:hypothetical protein
MTRPKTPLIGLQGGLVLSALRKKESKKKMSDEPFAWFPWLAESADEKREEGHKIEEVVTNTEEDDDDRDLQRAIALPASLTRVRKTRSLSNASAFSLGSWEPLDLTDLEPVTSEDSQDDEIPREEDTKKEDDKGASVAKELPTKDVPQTTQGRASVSYFASHVSVVILMLSLSFFGANSPTKESSLAVPIRGAMTANNRSLTLNPGHSSDVVMNKNHTVRLNAIDPKFWYYMTARSSHLGTLVCMGMRLAFAYAQAHGSHQRRHSS